MDTLKGHWLTNYIGVIFLYIKNKKIIAIAI